MAEAKRKGHRVNFDVLYYAKSRSKVDKMVEIGEKEGEFIRAEMPVLNTQIPKADNWRSYEINEIASTITLSEILS